MGTLNPSVTSILGGDTNTIGKWGNTHWTKSRERKAGEIKFQFEIEI